MEEKLSWREIEVGRYPCVYFLMDEGEIVYVGSTTQLMYRLGTHSMDKHFTHYSYIKCSYEEMRDLEVDQIIKHDPRMNAKLPSNKRFLSTGKIKEIYNMNKPVINKILRTHQIKPVYKEYYSISAFESALIAERS